MTRRLAVFAALVSGVAIGCGGSLDTATPAGPAVPTTALRFVDATRESGVTFRHVPTRTANKWMPEITGSGVAVADFNNDGAPDIFLVNSGALGTSTRPVDAQNRLFLNDGQGRFRDASAEWQVPSVGYGQGVAVGDVDNDGWADVFLTSFEGDNRLLRNTGQSFEDVTLASGIRKDGLWASSAGFFDADGDGDLDLYVVHYVNFSTSDPRKVYFMGRLTYPTPTNFEGVADTLWRNDGTGRFTDVSAASGIGSARANGLALAIVDIDKDGDQDVYVANDTDPNQLWLNEQGHFTDIGARSGSAYSLTGLEEAGMGVDVSDVDDNGLLDFVVTNFQNETTALYNQMTPLQFQETSDRAGIGRTARQHLTFGVKFFDADNDGDDDLIVANGHIDDAVDETSGTVTFAQLNSLYENLGRGRFTDVTGSAGDGLQDRQVSRGLAVGDFDGDGDLDVVVTSNGGTAQILRNESAAGGFVMLRLTGVESNRSAIGARVVARVGTRTFERQVMGAQSYLSVSDFRVHIGLGAAAQADAVTIHWPGGAVQELGALKGGAFYQVRQGDAPTVFVPGQATIR